MAWLAETCFRNRKMPPAVQESRRRWRTVNSGRVITFLEMECKVMEVMIIRAAGRIKAGNRQTAARRAGTGKMETRKVKIQGMRNRGMKIQGMGIQGMGVQGMRIQGMGI